MALLRQHVAVACGLGFGDRGLGLGHGLEGCGLGLGLGSCGLGFGLGLDTCGLVDITGSNLFRQKLSFS